jgi:hypothetical protein
VTAFDQLKQTLRDAQRLAKTRGSVTNTNVSVRRNIKIASNVGRDGAVERVTSIQDAPITQHGLSAAEEEDDNTAA